MKLIIIEGTTATGKTTLAQTLSRDLKMPLFMKDEYKEHEFDLLGTVPDFKQWKKLEESSWEETYKAISSAVKENKPMIVEANFKLSQRYKIKRLLARDTVVVEIFCHARGFTVLRRYIARNRSGQRHKGHRDSMWYGLVALEALLMKVVYYARPLYLTPNFLRVNTTHFSAIDHQAIRNFIDRC